MRENRYPFYLTIFRVIFSSILCAAVAFFVYKSIRWQVMWDQSIMHYVNFLMDHGKAPYRDIIDINTPGSYMIEGWAMHSFGGGDIAWRFYDFFLLGSMTTALIVISLPYDWFAGLFSGVLFLLLHGVDGPVDAGQREEVMTILIIVSYALLFSAMRRRLPLLMLPFGFVIGLAASLKPTVVPLGIILLIMMAFVLRKKTINIKPYLGYALFGLFAVLLINVHFLYRFHVFGDFIATAKRLVPYYASVGNASFALLLRHLFGKLLSILLVATLLLTMLNRSREEWENWERAALWLGVVFGMLSYFSQGKTFEHHAYLFDAFVFFCFALEAVKAMGTKGWVRGLGLASVAMGVFVLVPRYTSTIARISPKNEQPDALKRDLIRLGGSQLQNQVQCLDLVDGCISTLYRLRLLPYTGFMGDYMLFGPIGSPPFAYYRNILWDDLHKSPPKVIVLTNMWLSEPFSFEKINQWPQLGAFLNSAYSLDVTRNFGSSAYKIYVLRVSHVPTTPALTQDFKLQTTLRH